MTLSAIVPATNEPETLDRCRDAIVAALDPPDEVIVVNGRASPSPAAARNEGARRATGEILVFIDADVEVHTDVFSRIRDAFEANPGLTALFGSYDDDPPARGAVSSFRNLLHHHVHQMSAGSAVTFWAGLGAMRREAFEEAGGFAEHPIEDIELGMRLADGGASLVLDPEIQGKHLKSWSLLSMVRTDFVVRGVPWVVLLLRHGASTTHLNLGWRHRLSAIAALSLAGAVLARRPALGAVGLVTLVALNRSFYELLLRRRGPVEACAGVGLHVVHHLTGVAAVPVGALVYFREKRASARARDQG